MAVQIPVYLFTGFLESGKTKFIQETFEDERFNSGERTLILMCEEGIEEYDPSRFCKRDAVTIEAIDDESDINEENLTRLLKKHRAERVVVEYNGMWQLQTLYNHLPEGWLIYQEFLFVDATTFLNYNANMRSLVVDKLGSCELVAFNRMTPDIDVMQLHKIVRATNRRANIAYEYLDGKIQYDEIEDPLPFDLNAPVVVIEDKDYAIWYQDISEEQDKYDGKRVRFKGLIARNKQIPADCFVAGRHVMNCCAEDIKYMGLVCQWDDSPMLKNRQWAMIEGKIAVRYHAIYGGKGPVIRVSAVTSCDKPEEEVAMFY